MLNRFFTPQHLPVLLKISPSGGTLGTTTSNSSTVLSIRDSNGNGKIDLGEATDVRIKWGKESETRGTEPRRTYAPWEDTLCMDTSGVLWVGMYKTTRYYRVDPNDGHMLEPSGESQRTLTNPTVARWIHGTSLER